MAKPFKQYTKCEKPGDFVDFGLGIVGISNIILLALTGAFIALTVIWVAAGPVGITIGIATVSAVIIFLRWWLFGRLICLGPDPRNCAIIGMVSSHGHSDPSIGSKSKYGDNDYTMNIFLANGTPGPLDDTEPKENYWVGPQGHLTAPNPAVLGIGRGYPPDGNDNVKYMKFLHCEFEGDGIRRLLDAAYLALAFLIAALWIPGAWVLAALVALIALLEQIVFGERGDPGSGTPLDIGLDPASLDGRAVVVVKGDWIYDSFHEGWNEIHPVKDCLVVGHLKEGEDWRNFKFVDEATQLEFTLDSVANVERFRDFWCGMLKDAEDAQDGGSQDDPQHDWGIHPGVDGCKPPIIIL